MSVATKLAAAPSGKCPGSGKIIICERPFAIDWKVINWCDDTSISAYQEKCYKGKSGGPAPNAPYPFEPAEGLEHSVRRYRDRRQLSSPKDFPALQAIIRQFVIHHDGCATSRDTFHVLHDERGLSVHFLIDNDGTIYQTLDLAHCAYHAEKVNGISIGVELCNIGRVGNSPHYYSSRGISRDEREITVNGEQIRAWDYTREQYMAMVALGRALARLLPNLPQVYPQNMGQLIGATLENAHSFSGYLGHFHVTPTKWDPGCFDFSAVMGPISSKAVWFCAATPAAAPALLPIAQERPERQRQKQALIDLNERAAIGGYYPVGPYGKTRLWHGGIHLGVAPRTPVFSPFSGRLVAARQGPPVATGSRNFILIQHTLQLDGKIAKFYILYYHLAPLGVAASRPRWCRQVDQALLASEEVMLLSVPIGAGELIGHAGQAGPPNAEHSWQVHVEVISRKNLAAMLSGGSRFIAKNKEESGHFCDVAEVITAIDRPAGKGDGILDESELRAFFQFGHPGQREQLRRLVLRFPSEWGADPNYRQSLLDSPDFRQKSVAEQDQIFREQIRPSLWWTERVAAHTGLPRSFLVWHYHPVEFVDWIAGLLWADQERAAKQAAPVNDGTPLQDDAESRSGFIHDEDRYALQARHELTLPDLSAGYGEE